MENIKNFFIGMPWYIYLLLLLVFGLFLASWFVPPLGIIHPSVLQAGAIVLGFCWLFYVSANIPNFIHRGAKIKGLTFIASPFFYVRKSEIYLSLVFIAYTFVILDGYNHQTIDYISNAFNGSKNGLYFHLNP